MEEDNEEGLKELFHQESVEKGLEAFPCLHEDAIDKGFRDFVTPRL